MVSSDWHQKVWFRQVGFINRLRLDLGCLSLDIKRLRKFGLVDCLGGTVCCTRHEKSSKPSADAILVYLKFPQTDTLNFRKSP